MAACILWTIEVLDRDYADPSHDDAQRTGAAMRFLFSTLPGLGHFFPIVPLAWAARSAGHDVLIATTSSALEASGQAGLPAIEAALGPLPGNVRPTGWLPLSALVPTCRVLIQHGGAGTTMNALVAGVPQLVLPHGADQHANAAAVQQRGVGLSHLPEDADPATMGRSLQRLLGDPAFSQAADDVRREIAELPPAAEMVLRLQDAVVRS